MAANLEIVDMRKDDSSEFHSGVGTDMRIYRGRDGRVVRRALRGGDFLLFSVCYMLLFMYFANYICGHSISRIN